MDKPVAQAIETKLRQALSPTHLSIIDESGLHAGHAGARAGGESHFRVEVESAAFAGLSRVERQRRVHAVLAAELAGPVHALSLRLTAPGEHRTAG
ncbi:BolA family transcriptional regulator [Hypericibacter adhaerens]|uniref:BolA family transcriptional regulator n=1 Tax=Hypericibacter adhaerens TaxID=2602016 RepID=A0A5J6N2X1_9PROT|nr:BolA family protein [Hypericibacter adhaerens]QEX24328.1 BolA family transcriptional regulator [Hypericibacter adhaerens]